MDLVYGSVNLHELHRIMGKACEDQRPNRLEIDAPGTEALHPMPSVTPDDRFHIIFVDLGIVFADRINVAATAKGRDYLTAANERDLGVRD